MSTATLEVVGQQNGFAPEQVDIIRSQVAPAGTTDAELSMFLMYCSKTGLDPFARQIYLSERRSKNPATGQWTVTRKPETTIDGFRLIAERTKQYAGQVGPFWCGDDGVWKDVWLSSAAPAAAKVGILRHDFKEPLWAVALYSEYVQKTGEGRPNSMWQKMPANQLAKCAESLGHRRAFPRELSGLYSKEEMGQAEGDAREAQRETAQVRIEEERRRIAEAPAIDVTWADIDPAPNPEEPPKPLDQRESERKAEGLGLVGKPKAAKKTTPAPPVSFEMLEAFSEIKKMLNKESGSDELYYGVLKQYGFAKSSSISTRTEGQVVYKAMIEAHSKLTEIRVNREELAALFDKLTSAGRKESFWRVMGAHGQEDMRGVPPEALGSLLMDLREAAK